MNIELPESLVTVLENMDRNARAYGWEVGKHGQLIDRPPFSDDNPFLDANWRDNITVVELNETVATQNHAMVDPLDHNLGYSKHPEEYPYKYHRPGLYIGASAPLGEFEFDHINAAMSVYKFYGSLPTMSDDKVIYWAAVKVTPQTPTRYEHLYTTKSGHEIQSTLKLLPPELTRIDGEINEGCYVGAFTTHRYGNVNVCWMVNTLGDSNDNAS